MQQLFGVIQRQLFEIIQRMLLKKYGNMNILSALSDKTN